MCCRMDVDTRVPSRWLPHDWDRRWRVVSVPANTSEPGADPLRWRTLAILVAGRGGYRAAQYAAGLALLAIWGPEVFGRYAAATGTAAWLLAVGASGIERAALLDVAAHGRRREPVFVLFAALPFFGTLAACPVIALAWPGAVAYAGAAALFAGTACAGVLVGLFRIRPAPHADTAAFLALAVGYLLGVGLVATLGIGVETLLAVMVGTVAAINAALYAALRRGWPSRRPQTRLADLAGAARTAALLATGDVLGMAAVSVLFAEVELRAGPTQTSLFYVLALASSAVSVFWSYLLRVSQPRVLGWLGRQRRGNAWRRIRSLLVAIVGLGGTATIALVLATAPTWAVAVGALAVEITLFVLVTLAAFVLESASGRGRSLSAASAVVALVVVSIVGWPLVAAGGAAGALVALGAGWVARAAVLLVAGRRRVEGSPTPPDAARPSSAATAAPPPTAGAV